MRSLFAGILIFASATALHAETIETKYCGSFEIAPFNCEDVTRSSLIKRICYDAQRDLILLNLKGINYCKCGLGVGKVQELKTAPSMGRYFNTDLKGRFHCIGIDSRFPK